MLSPHDLARAFDRRVAAQRRGNTDGTDPAPDALSPLGATGPSVLWYARDGGVLGSVPGRQRGCYRVPADAVFPVPASHVPVLNDAPEPDEPPAICHSCAVYSGTF